MSYLDALTAEREACAAAGKTARVAAIDAEIKRVGGSAPVVETADAAPVVETAAVKRGPGRPRKPVAEEAADEG